MPLTKEQQNDLTQLSEYFKKIEKLAVENNIDLDVYMNEYREDGFQVYATERIGIQKETAKRKKVFEKATSPKTTKAKHH